MFYTFSDLVAITTGCIFGVYALASFSFTLTISKGDIVLAFFKSYIFAC